MLKKKRNRKPSVAIGELFELNCGVTVEVIKYENPKNITVTDGIIAAIAEASQLRRGVLAWKRDGKFIKTYCRLRNARNKPKVPRKYIEKGFKSRSLRSGPVEVIEVIGDTIRIRFEDTGHIKDYKFSKNFKIERTLDTEKTRSVPTFIRKHLPIPERWPIGSCHDSSKHGKFKILKIENCSSILIEWQTSGETQIATSQQLKEGSVRDLSRSGNYLNASGHYIYIAKHQNEIVYVGKGCGSRYTHCNSGRSSSYYLNKLHFMGEDVSVEILIQDLEDEESLIFERYLIALLKPKANVSVPQTSLEDLEILLPKKLHSFVSNFIP